LPKKIEEGLPPSLYPPPFDRFKADEVAKLYSTLDKKQYRDLYTKALSRNFNLSIVFKGWKPQRNPEKALLFLSWGIISYDTSIAKDSKGIFYFFISLSPRF